MSTPKQMPKNNRSFSITFLSIAYVFGTLLFLSGFNLLRQHQQQEQVLGSSAVQSGSDTKIAPTDTFLQPTQIQQPTSLPIQQPTAPAPTTIPRGVETPTPIPSSTPIIATSLDKTQSVDLTNPNVTVQLTNWSSTVAVTAQIAPTQIPTQPVSSASGNQPVQALVINTPTPAVTTGFSLPVQNPTPGSQVFQPIPTQGSSTIAFFVPTPTLVIPQTGIIATLKNIITPPSTNNTTEVAPKENGPVSIITNLLSFIHSPSPTPPTSEDFAQTGSFPINLTPSTSGGVVVQLTPETFTIVKNWLQLNRVIVAANDSTGFSIEHNGQSVSTDYNITINMSRNELSAETPGGTSRISYYPDRARDTAIYSRTITELSGNMHLIYGQFAPDRREELVYVVPGRSCENLLGFWPVCFNKTSYISTTDLSIIRVNESPTDRAIDMFAI